MVCRLGTATLAIFALAFVPSATLAPAEAGRGQAVFIQSDAVSAAKRYKRHSRRYVPRGYAYRPPVYAAPGYGRVGDPSLMSNGRPYARPYDLGGCIIDEGYGRFSACSDR